MSISIVITAFNEAGKIGDCLESVKNLGSEIIVVDSSSTDETVKIARKYTNKIFSQKNDPLNIDLQKNFGFTKANGDWILSLDADEKVTKDLSEEIRTAVSRKSAVSGYLIPRKNFIFGKWVEHTGWYPDYQLRLFLRGKGKYVSSHVHENIQVEGETGKLFNPILHENYQSVSQFIERNLLRYAQNEATSMLEGGYKFSYFDAIWFPAKEFLGRYFAREGYKDGFHGLVLSLLLAFYHLAIFAYIWEKKGFKDETDGTFLKKLNHEVKKISHEFIYWFNFEKIKNEKNPVKKIFLKTMKKLS